MKHLKIKIPDGFEVDIFNETTGEIKLKKKPKSTMERIKTVDDVLADHGLTQSEINHKFSGVSEHLKYQYIAELLCESLNEGWQADWSDNNQYKYYPWFYMGGSRGFQFYDDDGWTTDSAVGSRFCLKSRELAKYAGEQFTELYEKFMLIK